MRISVAGVTDISDRATRLLGEIRVAETGQFIGDAMGGAEVTRLTSGTGNQRGLLVTPYALNASTWDRIRNLQGVAPKFGLAVGGPDLVAGYGNALYSANVTAVAPAAANNAVAIRLRNPVASAERVVVVSAEVLSSAARRGAVTVNSPALADLATPLTEVPNNPGAPAATAVASHAANLAADPAGPIVRTTVLQAAVPNFLPSYIVLDADESMNIYTAILGALVGDATTLHVTWYEEAA